MAKIPGGVEVGRSLIMVRKSLKSCLRQVNQHAAKLIAKGQYEQAEAMVDVARRVDAFRSEFAVLQDRWKEVKSTVGGDSKADRTPLWEYYQPILKALESLGGESRTADITKAVYSLMQAALKPGDVQSTVGGRPRWTVMVRRAKKPMTEEGFLAASSGQVWKITAAGRRAAASGKVPKDTPGT